MNNSLSKILILAVFIGVINCQNALSQTQKHFTTITDDDILADFSCVGARRVSFYADKYNYNYNNSGITRFTSTSDKYKSNIIAPDRVWGNARVLYKIDHGDWIPVYDGDTKAGKVSASEIVYTDYEEGMPVKMERIIEKNGRGIDITYRLQTMMKFPVTVGCFEIPFPIASPPGEGYDPTFRRYDHDHIYEHTFIKHQYIAGDASYLYFTRRSGEPPYMLVMTRPGTRLEYSEGSSVFIHSVIDGDEDKRERRIKNTSLTLSPAGENGSVVEYGFRYVWVNSYDEMREVLYRNGLFDIRVVPGMTLPQDLTAKVSLHTQNYIDSVVAEYPEQTTIRSLGTTAPDNQFFEVDFRQLGENLLSIYYNGGKKTVLEFFSTEPVETLIKKRSAFITGKQQHRDTAKWYNGLYSVWDMEHSVLRGPDNTDGYDFFYGFVLAGDDPALCKAPFVAAKNVYLPDDNEIRSVEYYIENFVWGGLQRTDRELPNPYGIYSVPNWHVARDDFLFAGIRNNNLNKMNICRPYDYPHIIMLYYNMFRIAEYYPEKVQYLDAEEYLERAFQTAKAFYTYPYKIYPWADTYKWGIMNEVVILSLIDDLESHGRQKDATWLRNEWEKKVKYFVYDDKYPYHSEYCTGGTAFTSSYDLAKYGTLNPMKADTNLWYDTNLKKWYSHPAVRQEDSRLFMENQFRANLAHRGCIIPTYYNLGSTSRMYYTARMGGRGILDYGFMFAAKPWDWLQWGYASYLGSFALMNTGTAESNYGYWYQGKENDGAIGWTFNSGKGQTRFSNGKYRYVPHGVQPYDGEADLGNCAAIRMAETILTDDPLFGWFCYGGKLEEDSRSFFIIPRDGIRSRFSVIAGKRRIGIEFRRDGFLKENIITVDRSLRTIRFKVENRTGDIHNTHMEIITIPGNSVEVWQDRVKIRPLKISGTKSLFELDITGNEHNIEIVYTSN